MMRHFAVGALAATMAGGTLWFAAAPAASEESPKVPEAKRPKKTGLPKATTSDEFTVYRIGTVKKEGKRTTIVLKKKYQDGLLRFGRLSHVTVVYWFDRNDTPKKRAILRVHPGGNRRNPLTGVFATHSPVRPNLIAISRCRVLSVRENVIEIDGIDAFPDSPVLDLKS
jgi:tRNA-Thr(GGU) m(6)t(6)A37 methyltransferase TsaA